MAASGHSALTAQLVEEAGFEVVWASGLEISAAHGVPDANILSVTDVLQAASEMAAAVSLPVLADSDSGFGNIGNVMAMVKAFESADIAGICLEDKTFPKINSFASAPQTLVPTVDMVAKLSAAKAAQSNAEFVVIARTEALIAGLGMDEALRRAQAYEMAGADALVVHSRLPTSVQVEEFCRRYDGVAPLIPIPTSFPGSDADKLFDAGIALVIYANHTLRSAIPAMRAALAHIRAVGSTQNIEGNLCSIEDIFDLQGMSRLLAAQEQFQARAREIESRLGDAVTALPASAMASAARHERRPLPRGEPSR